MEKTTNVRLLALAGVFTLAAGTVKAQIVGTDAYIQGTYVEIGLDGSGGFEGCSILTSPPPAGMHYRSNTNLFGFVANPQMNGWASSAYDGDFFTPGSPENGWGFEIGTTGGAAGTNNAMNAIDDIPGAITSWSYVAPQFLSDWEGDYISGTTNLHFRINYAMQVTDLFYITTVSITNNSADTIPELYYYRNLDPDNNEMLTGDYTTQNTILAQPTGGGTFAQVSATQALPFSSYYAFLTDVNPGWRAGYGGFSNRDASDMWNGVGYTQTVSATSLADEAIYLAYKIQNMLPGATEVFKSCSAFDSASIACAEAAMRVSQLPIPSVTTTTPAFTLSGGYPAGGTYSGTGVSGNMFDPSVSGAGDFTVLYSYTDPAGCTSTTHTAVHVNLATGINEVAGSATVLYPNPFADVATLRVSKDVKLVNAELHIFDMIGKEVKNMNNISSNEIRIDRKGLSGGVYFYKLLNGGKEVASGKLIVK